MDMERALVAGHTLYRATHDPELKEVLDRADLCWSKWNDASDYNQLMQVCANIMSHMF
jgi:hypothetical protein